MVLRVSGLKSTGPCTVQLNIRKKQLFSSYLFHSVPSFSQRFQLSEPQNFSIVQQFYISCKACIRIHLAGSLKGHWTGHWTLGVSPLPWPAPSPRCTASPAATPRPSCRGRWQQPQHSRRRSKGRRWRRRRRSMASMRSRQGGRWKRREIFEDFLEV